MLYLFLLLTLFTFSDVSWEKYIIELNNSTENSTTSAQSIWTAGRLYYSSPDSIQTEITERIQSREIAVALRSNSQFKDFIIDTNGEFRNETLLLLSLLLEANLQQRIELFDEFYSENVNQNLIEINRYASQGEAIPISLLPPENFDFTYFLISFYLRNNQVASAEFFNHFSNYWSDKIDQLDYSSAKKDLLYLIFVKSAYESNRYELISSIYNRLINIKTIPPSSLQRNFFWGLDFAMSRVGEIDKSLDIQRRFTIPISEYIDDSSGLSTIYTYMGSYLYILGKYKDALEAFKMSAEQSDGLSDESITQYYNNLSLIYYKTGESGKYIETQLEALEHARELENYDHQNEIYRNLHIFYRTNRNWDLSKSYIERAEALALETNSIDLLVRIYVSQGVFEDQYLKDREAAYEKLKLAESFFSSDLDDRLKIRVYTEQANLYKKDENWAESILLYEKAKSLATESSNTSIYLTLVVQLAEIQFDRGYYEESRRLLRDFRSHDISVVDMEKLVLAQTVEAKLYEREGNYTKADELFAEATDLVLERARNTSELETGYWSVEPEYLQIFEDYTDFLMDHGQNDQALTLLDQVKTINDAALTENPLIKSSVLTEEELIRERRLTEEMDQLRKQLFAASPQNRLNLQNDLERLSAQKRELNRQLRSPQQENQPGLWTVQRTLGEKQHLIHITEINESYYVSKVNNRSVEIRKIPVTQPDTELFERTARSLALGSPNLRDLYQVGEFIGVKEISRNTNSIIVVPAGYFHQIPLDILPINPPETPQSYGSSTYLIERTDVRTVNSLKDVTSRAASGIYAHDFTGFGISDFDNSRRDRNLVSLPKAPQEIQSISESLNRMQSKQTFINDNATPMQFRISAGSSRILHMATHSEVSESDPLFSRLHFSSEPVPGPNGEYTDYLFAYELFDLNMQNQLIMLNSCESGAGRFLQGSGIMGVSRALRYAGAHSLILNAWSVNDQYAADFAELFYHYLNEGESKSRALQLTKIDFIKTKNANPHFWGPYILNGDNRPLFPKQESDYGTYILAAFFVFGIFVFRQNRNDDMAA